MGKNYLDTPLAKTLIIGAVVGSSLLAFSSGAHSDSASQSYTDAVQPLLVGRSDAQLDAVGDALCKMYKDGSTTDEVAAYLIRGGASADSADQLARITRAYKCPNIGLSKN